MHGSDSVVPTIRVGVGDYIPDSCLVATDQVPGFLFMGSVTLGKSQSLPEPSLRVRGR